MVGRRKEVGQNAAIAVQAHTTSVRFPPESSACRPARGRCLVARRAAFAVRFVLLSLFMAGAGWMGARAAEPAAASVSSTALRHWAFRPVVCPPLPEVRHLAWVNNAVDRFILATLESKGVEPSPPASRVDWLRRVTFDLTGLPPTPSEMEAFAGDQTKDAFEKVVDRLLASPRYGERWAQHWLDVVRYAESEGFEYDRHLPGAWRYRDYVIDTFNRDKPFNRFLTEQLAGDELEPANLELRTAAIFHRLGAVRRNAGNPDIALSRNEVLTERTDIVGSAFLGLTVGCARCHNHKLEPISQKDYYRLEAYFAATTEDNIVLATEAEQGAFNRKEKALKGRMDELRKKARAATGLEKEKLEQQLDDLEEQLPEPLPTIPSIRNEPTNCTPIHVLQRGVWEAKGEPVGPRPLGVLIGDDMPELPLATEHPRTLLAKWLSDPAHPLTARTWVNRLWLHHFGAGLVDTPNDFGTHGGRPSHPELLDWLAAALVQGGWRSKPLHRLMVLSSAYRQSSHPEASPARVAIEPSDPENRLLWRFNRRRLSAEELRDAMLAVSGRLNPKAGGPSVMVPVDEELVKQLYKPSQWQPGRAAAEFDRRSIYLLAKRNLRLPFMETFDTPALQTSCARRESSTHAPQALELLNGGLANSLAASFATRLSAEQAVGSEPWIDHAYRLALGRSATARERRLSQEFLRENSAKEFALALFNLNAFLYVP